MQTLCISDYNAVWIVESYRFRGDHCVLALCCSIRSSSVSRFDRGEKPENLMDFVAVDIAIASQRRDEAALR